MFHITLYNVNPWMSLRSCIFRQRNALWETFGGSTKTYLFANIILLAKSYYIIKGTMISHMTTDYLPIYLSAAFSTIPPTTSTQSPPPTTTTLPTTTTKATTTTVKPPVIPPNPLVEANQGTGGMLIHLCMQYCKVHSTNERSWLILTLFGLQIECNNHNVSMTGNHTAHFV